MTPPSHARDAGLSALSQTAILHGLPDPLPMADELLAIESERLADWFTVARRTTVWLWQGADLLSEAVPALSAGWSSLAPRAAIAALREAGLASRRVIVEQVDAADLTCSTLAQVRRHVDAALDAAQAAVAGLGPAVVGTPWSAGASPDPQPELLRILAELTGRLDELRTRASDALRSLALALRTDPRDRIEALPADSPTANPGPSGPAPTSSTAGPVPVDAGNLQRLERDLQSPDDVTRQMAQGVSASLAQAKAAGGVAQLLVYESANSGSQGRAAVGIGDIGTADNVATLVPGVASAPAAMSGGLQDAAALRAEAMRQSPGESTAVVAWYGYDIPMSYVSGVDTDALADVASTLDILNDDNARDGGAQLAQDIDRFRQWAPADARFTALGFSMGSTTVSAAAARGARLDDVVLMGSPGASAGVPTADSYPNLPADHTYVVAFDQDPVTQTRMDLGAVAAGTLLSGPWIGPPRLEPFGVDPALADFGAQVIDANSNVPDLTVSVSLPGPIGMFAGPVTSAVANQVQAFSHHSETNYLSGSSKQAAAAVVLGQYTDVPVKPGR